MPTYRMDAFLKDAIDRECKRHLAHKSPMARHLFMTHFVENVARGREQALLDLKTVKAEKAGLDAELDELYEWVSELEVRLGEWELEDGRPGPAQAKLNEDVRQLRVMNVALKGLTEAQEERLRDFERGPMRGVGIQTDPYRAVDPQQTLQCEIARLEGLLRDARAEVASSRSEVRRLECELESEQRLHELSNQAHYSNHYKPPVCIDTSRNDHLLEELDRLTHNEKISRNAVEFYERRHDFSLGQVAHLQHDIELHLLHFRSWMRERERDMMDMRRRLLGLASCERGPTAADSVDLCRWTRHELPKYLGLPSEPMRSAGDRHSAPPVLVVLPDINVPDVENAILFAYEDQERTISREAQTYRP